MDRNALAYFFRLWHYLDSAEETISLLFHSLHAFLHHLFIHISGLSSLIIKVGHGTFCWNCSEFGKKYYLLTSNRPCVADAD